MSAVLPTDLAKGWLIPAVSDGLASSGAEGGGVSAVLILVAFFLMAIPVTYVLARYLSTPTLDPPIKESVKVPDIKHERVTGTFRGDLEAAFYAWRNGERLERPPLSKASRDFNLWEDTLLAYIAYQDEKKWKEDFVKELEKEAA